MLQLNSVTDMNYMKLLTMIIFCGTFIEIFLCFQGSWSLGCLGIISGLDLRFRCSGCS